jgi:hypothetical protein
MKYKIFIKQIIISYSVCTAYFVIKFTSKISNLFFIHVNLTHCAVFRSVSLALRVRRPQGEEQGQALRPQEVRLGP